MDLIIFQFPLPAARPGAFSAARADPSFQRLAAIVCYIQHRAVQSIFVTIQHKMQKEVKKT
jgi:hypothetical protein